MEPARVEVAREAARLFWIGGPFESLDQVRLALRDGHAARINSAADSRLWLPRGLHERFDAGGDLLEAASLKPQLVVDGRDERRATGRRRRGR